MTFWKKTRQQSQGVVIHPQRGSWIRDSRREINPFAFTPKDLAKLHDPKDLSALRAIGGVRGLLFGLRTNLNDGLWSEEYVLVGKVTMEDVLTATVGDGAEQGAEKPIGSLSERQSFQGRQESTGELVHTSTLRRISTLSLSTTPQPFQDRKRIFSTNRVPQKRSKNLFQLMWSILQDRVLVLPLCLPRFC